MDWQRKRDVRLSKERQSAIARKVHVHCVEEPSSRFHNKRLAVAVDNLQKVIAIYANNYPGSLCCLGNCGCGAAAAALAPALITISNQSL